MIIWGWKGREIVQGGGLFHCPQCRSQQAYHLVRVATYFTLYFIPIFETQHHGDYLKCQNCQLAFTPEMQSYRGGAPNGGRAGLPRESKKRARKRRRQAHGDDYGL